VIISSTPLFTDKTHPCAILLWDRGFLNFLGFPCLATEMHSGDEFSFSKWTFYWLLW
jgi:hypothetical protein